jgi:hypothetical protein
MLSTLIFFFLLFVQMVDLFMAVRPLPNMFGWHYDKPGRTLLFFGILKGMWSHWGCLPWFIFFSDLCVPSQPSCVTGWFCWQYITVVFMFFSIVVHQCKLEWNFCWMRRDWWCWFQAETTWYTLDATFKLWMSILPINWKQFSLETRKKYVSSFKVL